MTDFLFQENCSVSCVNAEVTLLLKETETYRQTLTESYKQTNRKTDRHVCDGEQGEYMIKQSTYVAHFLSENK